MRRGASRNRTGADGQLLQTISGNGSSSCIAGWFIRFITTGPVGSGSVGNGDAIAIQLIKPYGRTSHPYRVLPDVPWRDQCPPIGKGVLKVPSTTITGPQEGARRPG